MSVCLLTTVTSVPPKQTSCSLYSNEDNATQFCSEATPLSRFRCRVALSGSLCPHYSLSSIMTIHYEHTSVNITSKVLLLIVITPMMAINLGEQVETTLKIDGCSCLQHVVDVVICFQGTLWNWDLFLIVE